MGTGLADMGKTGADMVEVVSAAQTGAQTGLAALKMNAQKIPAILFDTRVTPHHLLSASPLYMPGNTLFAKPELPPPLAHGLETA